MSDEELIKLAARSDKAALEILVKRHLPGLYRFCFGYLKDRSEAEDAVQEIYIKVWRALGKFDENKAFKPWLYGIAKHACLDCLKKKRTVAFSDWENEYSDTSAWSSLADASPLPEQQADNSLLASRLSRTVGLLSPKYAKVVTMHHSQELNFREIATITGQPLNTVKSRYRRAISQLRGYFGMTG